MTPKQLSRDNKRNLSSLLSDSPPLIFASLLFAVSNFGQNLENVSWNLVAFLIRTGQVITIPDTALLERHMVHGEVSRDAKAAAARMRVAAGLHQ